MYKYMDVNDFRVEEEIKMYIKSFLETNENESTMYSNLCDSAKAVLRGKVISASTLKKKKKWGMHDAAWLVLLLTGQDLHSSQ